MDEQKIPEDLQDDYILALNNPEEAWGPQFVRELIERIAQLEAEVRVLKNQLRAISAVESNRIKQLQGNHEWHPASWPNRPDFLAWRVCDDEGRIEILAYNNALCDPIYVEHAPVSFTPENKSVADPQTPKRWREILYFHQHPKEHPASDFCCDSGEESEVVLYAAQLEAENTALRERLAAYEKIMEESKIDTQGFDAETLAEIRHTNRPPMSERSAGE